MLTSHPHSNLLAIAGWLRPHRVLMAVVAVATGALACKDATTPKQFSTEGIAEPRFTAGVGLGGAPIGRGNVGTLNIKCKAERDDDERESRGDRGDESNGGGYCVQLKSKDNNDILVTNLAIAAGGHSGWHSHPGPVLVVVKTGGRRFTMRTIPPAPGRVTQPVPHSLSKRGVCISRATKKRLRPPWWLPPSCPRAVQGALTRRHRGIVRFNQTLDTRRNAHLA